MSKPPTHPLGKGTRNLTANVSNELYVTVSRLAAVSGTKLGEYVRAVLEYAAEQGLLVRENPADRLKWERAAAASEPLPKIRKEVVPPHELTMLRVAEDAPPPAKRGKRE